MLTESQEGASPENKKLLELIEKIKSEKALQTFDEASTKQTIILPILARLGWEVFDRNEVFPEYPINTANSTENVDLAIMENRKPKVFLEVKKIREELERHQEQILKYSWRESVKIAILTNGIAWWFYLPMKEGNWQERKFYTIHIIDQSSEEISQKLMNFLSRENILSGRAVEHALNVFENRQKDFKIKETLPKVWKNITTEPHEALIELISEETESLCGYKPSVETITTFMANLQLSFNSFSRPNFPTSPMNGSIPQTTGRVNVNYNNNNIVAFTLFGERQEIRTWIEMLLKICQILFNKRQSDFEQVLTLWGRKRPYFTRNSSDIRIPKKIDGTDIFVETNLGANYIVKISFNLLKLFGYEESELSIETR